MTKDEFIAKEITTWGEDYIFALVDLGYEAVLLSNGKWSWLLPVTTANPKTTNCLVTQAR